jgi:hypothetical protein
VAWSLWHAVPARRDQDLEHLLRARTAEVAGPESALAVLDRERPEQPDHRALPAPARDPQRVFSAGRRRCLVHRTRVPFGRITIRKARIDR